MPILAILIILSGLFGSPAILHAQDEAPLIEIPIPGLELSPIIRGSDYITIPWLAQYVGGVYTFLLSIAGMVAAVVMVVGGFQYLTSGGDKSKIAAGRKRIVNALSGLVLALSSYVILYVINPELTRFNGLQILAVQTDVWQAGIDSAMGTTEADTSLGEDPSVTTGAPPTAAAGDYTYTIRACPWTWETTSRDDRKEEFISKYQQYLTKSTAAERVLEVAEMADACDVILGSCGTTVGSIIAMAYKGTPNYAAMSRKSSSKNDDCLSRTLAAGKGADGPFNCNGFRLKELKAVSSALRKEQYGRRCQLDGFARMQQNWDKLIKTSAYNEATGRVKVSGLGQCNLTNCIVNGKTVPIEGCANTSTAARLQFLEKMQQAGKEGQKELVGYPDSWTNLLQPGDYINIYNGNTDLTGGHAQLFLGWGKDRKHAHVIQGGGGCGKDGITGKKDCGVTRYGYPCYTSGCGNSFMPITSIYRPY